MTMYVQYDELGNITATVMSEGIAAPEYERQLVFNEYVETQGKMVDINNLVLIDIPPS